MSNRKKLIAGNWKMNTVLDEAAALVRELISLVDTDETEVVVCPPFTHLTTVGNLLEGNDKIGLGAQNCHDHASGAFTGEISAAMLASVGVKYVILGHSERRIYFYENDALISKKLQIALDNGLVPIYCCGESLDERETERHELTVFDQLTTALFGFDADTIAGIIIAYEPVWAIGTGKTATPQQAQDMHAYIRSIIKSKYGADTAEKVRILYGGSVKASNAAELFKMEDIDGGLIGGASLNAREFLGIIKG